MLIRFIINNTLSFGEEREFNMLPMPRLRTLKEHKYRIDGSEILKMASIYGANGAGKSNLIKSLSTLQDLVTEEKVPSNFSSLEFKFKRDEETNPQVFVIEFFQESKAFLYGLEITNNIVTTEELYLSGLGKEDTLLFERKTDKKTKITVLNSELLESDAESKMLKKIIEKNLAKPNETIIKLLTTLDNPHLGNINIAFQWFEDTLQIVTTEGKPNALAHKIDMDTNFGNYAKDLMKSFHIGLSDIQIQKKTLKSFFGEDDSEKLNEIRSELEKSNMLGIQSNSGEEIIIVKEDEEIYVKRLQLEHEGKNNIKVMFNLDEESDGTVRLLDFTPAFQDITNNKRVYIIDEIERSIHPLVIKELLRKFSQDTQSKGQLIFTTHESNLLDQSIFRQDEIWFAEKDNNGSTDLYSLSDYKEHNSIDIRKGYLTGRYGSIPFLGNLKDLNWHDYAIE